MQMVNPWRVGLLALAACLAAALWALGWTAGFVWFGVPAMEPPFADLRTISGAVSSVASGLDPRLENPGDPWGRAFNYPVVWIWLFRALAQLGNPVAITGLFQAVLLLALGLRLADREAGPVVLHCAASPVMLLLVERGNNDGFILLLTLAGLRWSGIGAGMALGLAAGLKLYPIVAVPLAIRPPNERWRMAGLLLCAPLILWTVLQWDEIAAATPQAFWTMSFGAATTSLMLTEAIARTSFDLPPLLIAHPALIGHTSLLLATAALWLVAQDEYIQLDELITMTPPAESRMVVGFSLIFAALFVSGSSFAYRGVFVLPILWFFYRHRACPPCRAMVALGLALLWFPWLPHGWELFNLPAFLLAVALSPMLVLFGARLVRERLSMRSIRARAPSPRP
jgi:hypothetical protein